MHSYSLTVEVMVCKLTAGRKAWWESCNEQGPGKAPGQLLV